MYKVYILRLGLPRHFYVGYSKDFGRRLQQHISGRGAKATKIFGVGGVIYTEEAPTVEAAKLRERELYFECKKRGKCWGAGSCAVKQNANGA